MARICDLQDGRPTERVHCRVRGSRLIPISSGPMSRLKRAYAELSIRGLTAGALRLKAKRLLERPFFLGPHHHVDLEWRFLLTCLKGSPTGPLPELNWEKVARIAFTEGVAGILYDRLKGREPPLSILAPLREYCRGIVASNMVQIHALEGLEETLKEHQVEALVLKGSSLLGSVYPRLGVRLMEDIDLMVRPEDEKRFSRLLLRLGYRRDPFRTHFFAKGRIIIDLHTHALNVDRIRARRYLSPLGMEPVWSSSLPWKQGFRFLRRPDDGDNVLLLSHHLLKHSFSRLIWLMDIFLLLQDRDQGFWEGLGRRADLFVQRRAFCHILYLLEGLLGYFPPEESGFTVPSQALSSLEKALLDTRTEGSPPYGLGPIMLLFCVAGGRARLRLGLETLFPRKDVIRKEFRNTIGEKRPLFYPLRLMRAGTLLWRLLTPVLWVFMRSGLKRRGTPAETLRKRRGRHLPDPWSPYGKDPSAL